MDRMRRRAKRSSSACLVPFLSILLSCPRFLVFVLRDAVERGCAMLEFLSPRAVGKNVQLGSGSAGLGLIGVPSVAELSAVRRSGALRSAANRRPYSTLPTLAPRAGSAQRYFQPQGRGRGGLGQ